MSTGTELGKKLLTALGIPTVNATGCHISLNDGENARLHVVFEGNNIEAAIDDMVNSIASYDLVPTEQESSHD